jgi:hypothetical protein
MGATRRQSEMLASSGRPLSEIARARLREILHAKCEHIDFERGILFLPDSKDGPEAGLSLCRPTGDPCFSATAKTSVANLARRRALLAPRPRC